MSFGPRQLWRRSPRAAVGLGLFLAIAIACLAAPLIAPFSPRDQDVLALLQSPGSAHFFGTDEYGRDVLSRVLYGGRPTLLVAFATVLGSLLIGMPIGIVAGYYGGRRDLVIMRIVEFGFSLPALILAIAVVAFLGKGLGNVIIALIIVYAPLLARVARAATLSVSRQPFVLAARAIGERDRTIMAKQIAPNIIPQVLVQAALLFAYAVLAEASLSFLGLGTHGPEASWGRMLKEALPLIEVAPWMGIFPGVFLALTLIGLNLTADGLRDVLDPRARRSVEEAGAEAMPPAAERRGEVSGVQGAGIVSAEPLLRVADLSVRFPGSPVAAVDGIGIEVPRGGSVGLVGESGSGKSMTALAILGLTPPNATVRAERLEFEGRDLSSLGERERQRLRGARIGYVPQDPLAALNPVLTVGDQITEVGRMHPASGGRVHRLREVFRGYGFGARSTTTVDRAAELLEGVSIAEPRARAVQYPHQFSGGMRQRAIIASALSQAPSLVVADEPTTALDATVEKQVLDLLSELRAERGVAMLLVSHDLNVVSWHCDFVYVLYGGRLLEEASAERLFGDPRQPYTAALLAATPDIERPPRARVRKRSADAAVRRSEGCPFAARCPRALPVCTERFPEPTSPAPDHRFWCHNPMR